MTAGSTIPEGTLQRDAASDMPAPQLVRESLRQLYDNLDQRDVDFSVANTAMSLFASDLDRRLLYQETVETLSALLDLMMPRMNGLEMCRRLRATPAGRTVPVVMLTAKVQERDVEAEFAAGATDYLTKPFSPRELQTRVRAMLTRAEETRPNYN